MARREARQRVLHAAGGEPQAQGRQAEAQPHLGRLASKPGSSWVARAMRPCEGSRFGRGEGLEAASPPTTDASIDKESGFSPRDSAS